MLTTSVPSLSPWGRSRGATAGGMVGGKNGVVVVSRQEMMGQCLATGGCQTWQLLIINMLFINSHINLIIN